MSMGVCNDTSPASMQWVKVLLRFNLQPALYAHPSWLPIWARKLQTITPAVSEALSMELLCEHHLETVHDWDMDDRAGRLFMMESTVRDHLALALGVAFHRDSLRQVVLKPRLSVLRVALGETFDMLQLSLAEAVERSPVPISIAWSPFDGVALRERLMVDGYLQMLRLVDPSNRALRGRAVLCAPRAVALQGPTSLDSAPAARLLDGIVANLIPRWGSKWTWLF